MYRALVRVRLPRVFGLVLRNPSDSMFAVALALAIVAIVANGLYLQPGRHPAPIFAIRTRPVVSDEPVVAAAGLLPRRRPAEAGSARPEPAQRNDQARGDPVPLPRPRPPDQTGDVTNPSWQLTAVQRTLNQSGYGPVKVTGVLDDSTREGIARFERDHNLPITGQNTPRLRHALGAATGRSLD